MEKNLVKESEETEVKKDIEWLKEEIEEDIKSWGGGNPDYFRGASDAYENVKDWLNQLDEPEVLTQEWIDEHAKAYTHYGFLAVPLSKLQNLLVPKQEKVEVPQFVADILEGNTFADLPTAFEELFSANAGHYYGEDICNWIVANDELFARAWLDGYTVEEQKYYVLTKRNILMLRRGDEGVHEGYQPLSSLKKEFKNEHQITEKEIKDYDERYWAFAKPVEELEE